MPKDKVSRLKTVTCRLRGHTQTPKYDPNSQIHTGKLLVSHQTDLFGLLIFWTFSKRQTYLGRHDYSELRSIPQP